MNELSPWDDDPLDSAAQSTPTDSGPMPWDADPIEPRRNASPGRRMVQPIEGFDAPEEYGPEQPPRYEDMSVPARARAQLTAGLHGMDASTSMPALSATSRILQQMDRIDAGGALDPNDPESGPVQAYRMSDPATRQRTRGVFEQQLGRSITHIINAQARQQAQPRNPRAEAITRAGNEGRWGDAWRIFRDDPAGIIQQFTVESIPASAAMMVPGVGAAAAGAGRVGTGIAAYLGSAGTEFGSQQLDALNDALQRAGVDANDPAAMQAWVRANPDALREMVNAAARGMNGPAIFDALTLGFGRGIVPGRGVLRNTGRVGANFAAESAGEPAGAALGQVLAEGEVSKPGDLIGEFLGGVGQVGPTTAAGTIQEMREARAAGALPVQPPAPQPAPVPAPQTPQAGPTTPAPAAPPAAPASAAAPSPPPPVAPAASSPADGATAGAAAPFPEAPAPGAAAVPPAAPAEAAAGVAPPPPAPAAPSPDVDAPLAPWQQQNQAAIADLLQRAPALAQRIRDLHAQGMVAKQIAAETGLDENTVRTAREILGLQPHGPAGGIAFPSFGAPEAAPPPPANTGRADLEAILDDPRSAAQIEADRATERAAGISALEQGLPQGWSVVDEDGAVSVLDPNGEWAFQWDTPPADPTQTLAEARQMHDDGLRSGLYGEAVREGDGTRAAPVQAQNPGDVDAAATQATQPTPAQAQAGNYAKGHLRLHGLDLAIENPRGSTRSGVDADGRPWSVQMPAHYGEVKRTEGADGDPVDVYLGPQAEDAGMPVFVVDQIDPDTGRFDEHKVMLGFGSDAEAVAAYNAGFSDGSGPRRRGAITRMSLDEFKAWLHSAQRGPVARESIKAGIQIRRAEKARQREAEKAAKAPKPQPQEKWRPIGVNAKGMPLFEDENGVRSYTERGMRMTETVGLKPNRAGGWEATIDKSRRGRDWSTAEEWRAQQPQAPAPTPEPEEDPAGSVEIVEGVAEANGINISQAELRQAAALVDGGMSPKAAILQVTEAAAIEAEGEAAAQEQEANPSAEPRAEDQAGAEDAGAGGAPAEADGEGAAGTPPPGDEPRAGGEDTGPAAGTELGRLARAFGGALIGGRAFASIAAARQFAAKELGRAIQPGTPDAKMVDEAVEAGVVMAARLIVQKGRDRGASPAEIFKLLVGLYQAQPRVGVRTADSIERQAYSTPAPLAWVASELAEITSSDRVLEPTAGTGMLLIGADPALTDANEIDPERRAILKAQGFEPTGRDASQEGVFSPGAYHSVIANPPFGAVRGQDGQTRRYDLSFIQPGYQTGEVDHAIALRALDAMQDDGAAVLILGGVAKTVTDPQARANAYNGKAKREFFFTLYRNYRVVDHFTVSGELYAKQGAAWPVDVVVIRGRGKSDLRLPSQGAPRIYSEWSALEGLLNERNRDDRSEVAAVGQPADGVDAPGQQPGAGGRASDPGAGEGGAEPDRVPGGAGAPDRVDGGAGGGARGGDRADTGDARGARPVGGRRGASGNPVGAGGRAADGQPAVAGLPEPADRDAGRAADAGAPGAGGGAGGAGDDAGGVAGSGVQPGDGSDLDALFDEVMAEEFGPSRSTAAPSNAAAKSDTPPRPSPQVAASAATNTARGMADIARALESILLPKGGKISSNPLFDPEQYQRVLPLMREAVQHFRDAWADLKELMRRVIRGLTEAIPAEQRQAFAQALAPYIKRFAGDVQSGAVKLDEVDASAPTVDAATPATPEKASEVDTKPAPKRERKKQDEPTDRQVPYTPRADADGVGTLVPVNMQTAVSKALSDAERRANRPLVEFVADRLDYTPDEVRAYFSAEQIDALALAIDNVDRDAGFVIGDQTGVGKGRFVAAMIRYAQIKGLVPIFVTEKPNLYADMARDLTDIGMADALDRIVPTNSSLNVPLSDEKGGPTLKTGDAKSQGERLGEMANSPRAVAANRQILFTTYSQLQQIKGDDTARIRAIQALAPNAFVILDESHNAGGAGKQNETSAKINEKKGKRDRGAILRSILRAARSAVYSSATWAKRPDVMDLYGIKTDMRLAVPTLDALADAISKGGVPMQQIVSAMMAQSGQYIRRERSFAGVTYDPEGIEVDRATYDAVAGVMAGVFRISKIVQAAAKGMDEEAKADAKRVGATATDAGVESMNFGAVMHNLINQMLLASKAPGTVRLALERLKMDQKPVIALANTMGSFIEEFAEETKAAPGDRLDLTFNSLLDRYLRKVMILKVKKPFAKKEDIETIVLTPDDLGPEGERAYRAVEAEIKRLNLDAFPVSPIDYIRAELAKAGYKVGEITGRTQAADYRADGGVYYRRRPSSETTTRGRLKTIGGFNNGELDVIILNQSGATGLSLHASEKFKDQRKRVMIISQAEANIDTHMQMLGRVHRTGQVVAPAYLQLVADVPAEKRPAAILAKKMASLAAATTANRRGALAAEGAPDFINEFGDRVIADIVEHDPGLWMRLGQPKIRDDNDQPNDAARRVTGRIPLLPLAEQEALYEQIEEAYRRAIQMADEQGNNTLEAKTVDLDAKIVEEHPWTEGTGADSDRLFAGPSTLGLYDVAKQTKPPALYTIVQRVASAIGEGENAASEALKAMDRDALMETLGGWAAAAEGWAEQEILHVERTAREATEALDDKPMSDKERGRASQRITDQRDRLKAILQEAWPGGFVRVTRDGETTPAMVLHVTAPTRGNRNAPGAWEVGLLFGDGRRMDVSAAAVFTPKNQPQSGDDKGDVDRFVVENVSDSTSADEFLAGVEAAASNRRERRYIVTGNLLAGFSKKRGQILNFYNADGQIQQGIMLASDFDLEKFQKGERPAFVWDDAVAYLRDSSVPMTAAVVETDDGNVRIARNDRGDFVLTVPESKKEGADWFGDRTLQGAVGAQFVSSGGRMRVTVRSGALQEVMRRIGLIATTKRLELTSQATEAKAWVAKRKEASANDGNGQQRARGGPALYANPFDPALFNRLVWQPLREALGGSTALNGLAAKIGGLHRDALGRIFRDPPLPPNSTIENRAEAQDVTALARWFKTPERMFAKWPALARLVQDGMRAEQRAGVWRKRLTDEYEAIRTTLRREKGDWQKVAEALYLADAEAVDLDSTEAAREFFEEQGLSPVEAKATAALHRLLMKQGRLVDQHRRAMMPVIRARKAEIWRRMERVLNSASVDSKDYQTKYRRRAYLNARIKAGKGDLAAHAAERDALTAELREIRTNDPEIRADYDALREDYDALEARLADTSIRNRIKGYFPHKFYGSWRLYRIEKDADGKDQRVEITSDQGFYDSRGEAIAAARAYAAEHPGARLHIEPRKVSFPEALSGTPVTDANFRRISEGLAEEAALSPDEVRAVLKGKLRRRSRRRVLSAAMKRAGAEGFAGAKEGTEAEMADRVLRTHINQIVRYVTMDRLKAQYVNTTERMGLSPGRLNSIQREGRLQLFNALEAWWRDVNGAKQGFEQVLDGALQRMGLPGSTLAAAVSGAAIGGLVSPYVAPVLAGYAGYRMFKAMTKGGEFPTRAVIGGVVGDMAHLKLGMLVNIGSALVNLTQTMVNTFPLLGAKWTAEGAKRAAEAMWSMSRNRDNPGRMSEDAHILRRLDVVTEQRYTEENEIVRPALSAARRLSMFWFERAERVNRATAALGAYHRALDRGATPGAAFEEARRLMTRTQFHQGAANRPELLRQQWARIPTQFQNFMYQQIAFAFGLRGKAEISRFLIALLLVAGFLGLPGLQILDWLLGMVMDQPPLLMARLWAIDRAAGSTEAMTAAQVLLRGLPALGGVDISGRVGMGKGFGPDRPSDLAGPTIGSLIRLAELTRREAPILEQLGAVSPAANQAREAAGLVDGGARTSGMRRGYVEDQPTTGERVRALVGLRPVTRSVETDVREGQREATEDRRRSVDRYIARIVQAVQDDRPERIQEVRRQAAEAGIRLTQRQIVDAVRDSRRTRAERDIRRAPREIRPDVANRQRAVEEFRGTGP